MVPGKTISVLSLLYRFCLGIWITFSRGFSWLSCNKSVFSCFRKSSIFFFVFCQIGRYCGQLIDRLVNEKGSLIFAEKDGEFTGEVKFTDGYKVKLKDVTYENGSLKCNLYIDYSRVDITATIDGNKMTGTVKSSEGDMKIIAKKVE